jgi:hypothetical protein
MMALDARKPAQDAICRWFAGASRASLATALACFSALLAACGGGASPGVASLGATASTHAAAPAGASASAPYTNALEYARCMRRHGEPDFPDPNNPGGFSTRALAQSDTASRQFISADSTCQRLLPNDGQPTPAELQQTITDGLKFARCMRAHGVAFPDPGISGEQMTINLADVDTSSPKYLAAAKVCKITPG